MIRCPRAGCAGALDQDGFCDLCGLEAASRNVSSGQLTGASGRTDGVGTWSASSISASGSVTGAVSLRSSSSGRGMLGVGLVEVPPVPYRDPTEVVLDDPQVPESQRFCGRCGAEVGRTRNGRPGLTEGFCPKCGQRFSFTPILQPGQVLHEQYKVLGCLAHGGMGWIYLARDMAVSGRWVVLKGLIDGGDAEAATAAIAERHFLAKVEHPNIVKIHNFVQHSDELDTDSVGYIVMEYVGGKSLKDLVKQLRVDEGPRTCMPVEQALAHAIEMLRPLGYLHNAGLVYCDVKPDNVIQTQEQLKLIDLGAVRLHDDRAGAVFGTEGYQAPEVAETGPSPASDLYSVGRTLAVLSIPFDFRSAYVTSLPPVSQAPQLAEHESLHRVLSRACHPAPARRFHSAAEMAEQLTGVLREVLAASDGQPRPATSTNFAPELATFGTRPRDHGEVLEAADGAKIARALPAPIVDGSDSSAQLLATLGTAHPAELIDALRKAEPTVEVQLRRVRAYVALDEPELARQEVADMPEHVWRSQWAKGLTALASGKLDAARRAFDSVVGSLPGELTAKLALAASAELGGNLADAERYYGIVWRTDRSFVSAAFGLARVLLACGRRPEAVAVLGSVPATSAHFVTAQQAAVRASTAADDAEPTMAELADAGDRLERLDLDGARRGRLESELLEAALAMTSTRDEEELSPVTVLGCLLEEYSLRLGLEERYRALARHAATQRERYALVDRANQVRPWTWV
ncbi:MAG: protein kinase [Actinophytocola sp.]|nr:protein kinase [Actinophytocola sp.]